MSIKEDAKSQLYDYLDNLLNNYPMVKLNDLKSLTQLRSELRIGKLRVINWVNEYLTEKFGFKQAQNIKQKLWPYRTTVDNQIKQEKLFKVLDSQFKKYYPDNLKKITSLTKLKGIIGTRRSTITDWVSQYLNKKYGSIRGNLIFKHIWTIRQQSRHIAITHQHLKKFIKNREAKLITSELEFNNMKEIPTSRYIEIECEKGHNFKILVLHLLYHNQWCPSCNLRFCQKIMQLYMEAIFKVNFPETTLKKAYGINKNKGGNLIYDGFNNHVAIKGNIFKIAYEYDGVQHDIYPNPFHRTYNQFKKQKENDRKKEKLANNFNTILIRLKEINGFNSETISSFQKEIIEQFYKATGINLKYEENLIYDPYNDSLIKIKTIDQFINKDHKESNKKANASSSDLILNLNNKEMNKLKTAKREYLKKNYYKNHGQEKSYPFDLNRIQDEIDEDEDEMLWISAKVREDINENAEKTLNKVRGKAQRKENLISIKEIPKYSKRSDLDSHMHKKEDLKKQGKVPLEHSDSEQETEKSKNSLLDFERELILKRESLFEKGEISDFGTPTQESNSYTPFIPIKEPNLIPDSIPQN
ncbi:MAG: hypothetical protein EU532_02430 [Promethearchaeota archaeon]|nr:MAG: hypothetical protein EU532_02430 [Candidatus Lokiarchaeota archaeon]